jgi:hypothetical protein
VIRFGVVLALVVAALGLLAGGMVTSSLPLVYLAIGVAALAALMLTIGAVIWRGEIFGPAEAARPPELAAIRPGPAAQRTSAAQAGRGPAAGDTGVLVGGDSEMGPAVAPVSAVAPVNVGGIAPGELGDRPPPAEWSELAPRPERAGSAELASQPAASSAAERTRSPELADQPAASSAAERAAWRKLATQAAATSATSTSEGSGAAPAAATAQSAVVSTPGGTGQSDPAERSGQVPRPAEPEADAVRAAGSAAGFASPRPPAPLTWPPPSRPWPPVAEPAEHEPAKHEPAEGGSAESGSGEPRPAEAATVVGSRPATAEPGPSEPGSAGPRPTEAATVEPGSAEGVAVGEPTAGSGAEIAEREPAVAAAEAEKPRVGQAASPGNSPEPDGSDGEQAGLDDRAEPDNQAELDMNGLVTVVPGIARYHRAECILIRFLGADDLETMTRSAAQDAAMVPCRACQPAG